MAKNKYREAHPEWFDEKGRPTPEVLRALIDYDPETGRMTWKERGPEWFPWAGNGRNISQECSMWNKKFSGKHALTDIWVKNDGNKFLRGRLFSSKVYANVIAYAVFNGEYCDHLNAANGDYSDIRIDNIKPSHRAHSSRSGGLLSKRPKSSLFFGVGYFKSGDKWRARIKINGVQKSIGYFNSEEEAADAYDRAALKYFGPTAYLNMAKHPDLEPIIDTAPVIPPRPSDITITDADDF